MFQGQLLAIAIATGAKEPMHTVDSAEAIPGRGLRGDRYGEGKGVYQKDGEFKPEQEVTFIEEEAIAAVARDYELPTAIAHIDTRRNLLTREVPLNHLVDCEFSVGEVVFKGVDLCEPCRYLEGLTCYGVEKALLHRGGLRAQVIRGGTMRPGDAISLTPDA